MKRINQTEWRIINAALAYYQASIQVGDLEVYEADEKYEFSVAVVREKVWDRMGEVTG